MTKISFLHLTDLHQGLPGQQSLYPSIRQSFFEDLTKLHDKTGSIDLVLFTGDLTQGHKTKEGQKQQFQDLENTLLRLWEHLDKLGSSPKLLAVPGNHDLFRPDPKSPVIKALNQWLSDEDIRQEFWENPNSEYRKVAVDAFASYVEWLDNTKIPKLSFTKGLLPGDFSASYEKDGLKLAVVGLNSSFLQLSDGDFEKRLDIHVQQLQSACLPDLPQWLDNHDFSILMTHHPITWLSTEAQKHFNENIYTPGSFLMHLFGHMHDPNQITFSTGGAKAKRHLQGASIFGLETWLDTKNYKQEQRIHGYSICSLSLLPNQASIEIFPRIASKSFAGSYLFARDSRFDLDENTASFIDSFNIKKKLLDLTPYIDPQHNDNVVTKIFKESFKINFTINEKFIQNLKNENKKKEEFLNISTDKETIPDSVIKQIETLKNFSFTKKEDFLKELERVLQPLDVNKETIAQSSNFKKYSSLILKHTNFNIFDEDKKWLMSNNVKTGFFTIAGNNYKDWLDSKYNTMKILGMPEPIKLDNIYTTVHMLETPTSEQITSLKNLKKGFDGNKGFCKNVATKDGVDLLNEKDKIILLGKPGAGKSTFLKYIALKSTEGLLKENYLPILVVLKEFSDSGKSLIDFITNQFTDCNFINPQTFISYLLKEGKCLLLFDSLDEVQQDKEDRIINDIYSFVNEYRKNKYILSCRIAHIYNFDQFTNAEMADFNDDKIRYFINCWFGKNKETAQLCWEELEKNPRIKEIGSIPLLLTLLCIVFRKGGSFPRNKAQLYQKAIKALLKTWDSEKRIQRQTYQELPLKRKERMFNKIAYDTFEKGEYFLQKEILERHIETFISKDTQKNDTLEIDAELILTSIQEQHGIFVNQGSDIYSFSHLTFHEYFTASYIVQNEPEHEIYELIDKYLDSENWRHVSLLIGGLLEKADDFLLVIKKKIDNLPKSPIYTYPNILCTYLNKLFNNDTMESIIKSKFPYIANNNTLIRITKFCTTMELEFLIAQDRANTRKPELARSLSLALEYCRQHSWSILEEICVILDCSLIPNTTFNDTIVYIKSIAACINEWLSFPIINPKYKAAFALVNDLDYAINLDRSRSWRSYDYNNTLQNNLKKGIEFFKELINYLYLTRFLLNCLADESYVFSEETKDKILDELFTVL